MKPLGLTEDLQFILDSLSIGEGSRISGVAVKCVEIGKNTGGEGGFLAKD